MLRKYFSYNFWTCRRLGSIMESLGGEQILLLPLVLFHLLWNDRDKNLKRYSGVMLPESSRI